MKYHHKDENIHNKLKRHRPNSLLFFKSFSSEYALNLASSNSNFLFKSDLHIIIVATKIIEINRVLAKPKYKDDTAKKITKDNTINGIISHVAGLAMRSAVLNKQFTFSLKSFVEFHINEKYKLVESKDANNQIRSSLLGIGFFTK
jgi:hypothetical protein